MEKILITGGSGFFASRFAEKYKYEYKIASYDKKSLDITNDKNVKDIFYAEKPDIVIHTAAIAVTDFCNKFPEKAYQVNVEGTLNVARMCREVGSKMVFISSEQIFNGNKEPGPYDENHLAVPDTVYGQNKLECEKLLNEILDKLWIVRFTWLFGCIDRNLSPGTNIMREVITSILKGDKIKASPNEFRGMTYVWDMVEQFDNLFKSPYDTYNLGSENEYSRYEIVEYIFKEMGLSHRISDLLIKDEEKYKDHPRDVRLSAKKARDCGMVFDKTSSALKRCIEEYHLSL